MDISANPALPGGPGEASQNNMKIDIIGSVASGKTTLASSLSKQYGIPFYEKDNIVWVRTLSGDVKRSEEERDTMFHEILQTDHWIVEGSPRECLQESFSCCDYIFFLDVATGIRLRRVLTRWVKQRWGKAPYNSKPTLDFLRWNIRWVFEFNRKRDGLIEELSIYGDKLQIFKDTAQAEKFLKQQILGEPL